MIIEENESTRILKLEGGPGSLAELLIQAAEEIEVAEDAGNMIIAITVHATISPTVMIHFSRSGWYPIDAIGEDDE